ncbi:hypothetical protein BACCAP_01066 [Pseudoflavonifractor capillosus ATCC 29799]|uniref:Uncharacterized protein n=1 Tax=Pseudoflavonifractor capillosus ATCC 29799 TaxID=411467 RepID=A6NS87_9FIRM|nr:hypothetical protein BACCAP_01066 [Pseudoflavonifractor capillosus ATCC 29799]
MFFVRAEHGSHFGTFTDTGGVSVPKSLTVGIGDFRNPALCDFGSGGRLFLRKMEPY